MPTETRTRLDLGAMALLAFLCALWGVQQVAIKVAGHGISPFTQAGLRSTVAGTLLVLWCRMRGVPLLERDARLGYGATIATLFALEFAFVYTGLGYTTASRAVLFLYTAPFWVALGAHWTLPGERLSRVKLVGLALAFVGLALAFADALRLPSHRELIGDVMEMVGALCWAVTTLVIKARARGLSPHKTLFYQLAGSAVLLLGLALVVGERGVWAPTPVVIGALAYQSIVTAFASYLAWFWLLARYPASLLIAFSFFTPIFGMLAGALLLGEPVTAALAAAIAVVAAGIYLVNRP